MAGTAFEEKSLLNLFDEGFALFQNISTCEEPTNSLTTQSKIKQAMRTFEDVTRLTSMAGIFSSNESVDEVATENLRLFLLPALLGTLALKLTVTNRMEVVEMSDVYFRDFLQRCNDYGLCEIDVPPPVEIDPEELERSIGKRPVFDMVGAARNRATKIQRFREEKALEEELACLAKAVLLPEAEDDVKREYYIKLVKSYSTKAEEELDCLQTEKMILVHMRTAKKEEALAGKEEGRRRAKHPPLRPLMPVIITKDLAQKKVFGAGYPSLPTMTVQEFYDQRVKDGIFPDPKDTKGPMCLQDLANEGASKRLAEEQEKEDEKKTEEDDEETLQRMRRMDEYKDDHKRGWGNRYNRS